MLPQPEFFAHLASDLAWVISTVEQTNNLKQAKHEPEIETTALSLAVVAHHYRYALPLLQVLTKGKEVSFPAREWLVNSSVFARVFVTTLSLVGISRANMFNCCPLLISSTQLGYRRTDRQSHLELPQGLSFSCHAEAETAR